APAGSIRAGSTRPVGVVGTRSARGASAGPLAGRSVPVVAPASRPARLGPPRARSAPVSPTRLRVRRTVAVLLVAAVAMSGWALVRAALGHAGGGPLAAVD